MPALTRLLGAVAALAGMTAFACHVAVPIDVGGDTATLAELGAPHRNVGVVVHLLLLAALGLSAAVRPDLGARTVALGGLGLPWLAGSVGQLWAHEAFGASRAFAGAVLLAMAVVAAAVVAGAREVTWADGGILLGDGLAVLVTGATLWGLLGVSWYRVRDLGSRTLFEPRFGALLDTRTAGGRAAWCAAGLAVAAVAVAAVGGGWGRRAAGATVVALCGFEAARRTFLSGERLLSPADQDNPFGATLSGEPVLGLLVLPLVGMAAGAWFLTTAGEPEAPAAEPDAPAPGAEPA